MTRPDPQTEMTPEQVQEERRQIEAQRIAEERGAKFNELQKLKDDKAKFEGLVEGEGLVAKAKVDMKAVDKNIAELEAQLEDAKQHRVELHRVASTEDGINKAKEALANINPRIKELEKELKS